MKKVKIYLSILKYYERKHFQKLLYNVKAVQKYESNLKT